MMRYQLRVPELGLDDCPITVTTRFVPRGGTVEAGQPVVEVLAGPATIDVPAMVSGVLARWLVEEDETVIVGQALAVIETEE